MALSSRTYKFLVWFFAIASALLFLEYGARYALYISALHRSYTLTQAYYEVDGGFWEFKERYEESQAMFWGEAPFTVDIYNRKFFLPQVTGHYLGFDLELQDNPAPVPAPGVTRILCMGTSTTQEGYPDILRERLEQRSPGRYEVINAGIPGASTLNLFMNYSLIWAPLQADLVLIEHNVDAVVRNGLQDFAIDEDFDSFEHDDLISKVERVSGPATGTALATLLRRTLKSALNSEQRRERPSRDGLLRYRTILTALIHQVRGAGATPVLITYQPSLSGGDLRGDYSPEFHAKALAFYNALFFNFTPEGAVLTLDAHNRIMREVAEEQGVQLIEAAELLPREDVYFVDATHHSDEGNDIVALEVMGALFEPQEPPAEPTEPSAGPQEPPAG